MSGYKFDVFISYSRRGNVQKWLLNHFYPKLQDCLADQLAPAPTVYIDRLMPHGVHWPSSLKKALRHTKIMIPVLTPQYFESRWCMAEWRSMREREKLLGLADLEIPQSLRYPILYADSQNFPDEGRELAWQDFKEHSMPDPGFQDSREYVPFHRRVVTLAEDLAELLVQVPAWQPDWPLIDLEGPYHIPPPPLPRFDP
ncbi:TIR domain-containing protein [Actinophytocola sediminis]